MKVYTNADQQEHDAEEIRAITGREPGAVMEAASKLLKDGWRLLGGLMVIKDNATWEKPVVYLLTVIRPRAS